MRQKLVFLVMLLCSVYASAVDLIETGPERTLTKDDALEVAQSQFKNKDVDYFIRDDTTRWSVFVDAEPMKGWEHLCYELDFSKTTIFVHNKDVMVSKKQMSLPSNGHYQPLLVKNRYGLSGNQKPYVTSGIQTNAPSSASQRTYAVIISGGCYPAINHERYWNDCSFIYQTLVRRHGVPKDHIYPIMSDGIDIAPDMLTTNGELVSQNLDLDGDGKDEIKLAATRLNIMRTLANLSTKLKKDDHLFVYVIDHGVTTDNDSKSYICLWDNDRLSDSELGMLLTRFILKKVNVNVVLGQCFSGGFIDNLTTAGCVVATACKGNEVSHACIGIPYDEFVYNWTCAINGADHNGKQLTKSADTDNNHRITMEEAFTYAKGHDRAFEHPQYVSTPLSIGEDLAFNHLPDAVDLYVKDNLEDTGKEPNLTTEDYWASPSIWVRHKDDSIYVHQNPEFSKKDEMNYIYVKVYNRGKEKYTGGKYLHVYWAKAATGITPQGWKGREVNEDNNPTGGHLEAQGISKVIEPGDSTFIRFRWPMPYIAEKPDGEFHYCLMAKIMDTPYDDGFEYGVTYFDVINSNDQAQRNVTLIYNTGLDQYYYVYVRNVSSTDQSYNLEFVPQTQSDRQFYKKAHVEMELSPKVYAAWERGGFKSQSIETLSYNPTNGNHIVRLTSPESKLLSVNLQGEEFDVVKMKFKFNNFTNGEKYTFNLVQRDSNGKLIGGETFVVESPISVSVRDSMTITPLGNNRYELGIKEADNKYVRWLDEKSEEIACSESIVVTPSKNNSAYTAISIDEEGRSSIGSLSLTSLIGIKSVSAPVSSGNIYIELQNEAPDNSLIQITSVVDGLVKKTEILNAGLREHIIDSGSLEKGVYTLTYLVNDEIIDTKKVKVE